MTNDDRVTAEDLGFQLRFREVEKLDGSEIDTDYVRYGLRRLGPILKQCFSGDVPLLETSDESTIFFHLEIGIDQSRGTVDEATIEEESAELLSKQTRTCFTQTIERRRSRLPAPEPPGNSSTLRVGLTAIPVD